MEPVFKIGCDVYKTNDTSRYRSTLGTIEKIEGNIATVIYNSESTWVSRYKVDLNSLTMSAYCYVCEENNKSQ